MVTEIALDLGTNHTLIYTRGKGVIFFEPTIVACPLSGETVIFAMGEKAYSMLGKTPDSLRIIRPVRKGVIVDYAIIESILRYLINKVCGRFRIVKPKMIINIPTHATSVEKRALISAALKSGVRKVYLVEEALASAIGAGLPITTSCGNMVVNIGGGTCDIGVISLGGIVVGESVPIGGDILDNDIQNFIRKNFQLLIGEATAQEIKMKIGSAYPQEEEKSMVIKGRDLSSGMPKKIRVASGMIREAMAESLTTIILSIRRVLSHTPPELLGDIMENGIYLTGGTSLLSGLDKLIATTTGVPVRISPEPIFCVIQGLGKILEEIELLKKVS